MSAEKIHHAYAANKLARTTSVSVVWLFLMLALYLCFAYFADFMGPGLLILLILPNFFGVHALISWQWVMATIIADLYDVRIVAPFVATFGYCIVGCPYYAMLVNMALTKRIGLHSRVKKTWFEWICRELFNFSDKTCQIIERVLDDPSVSVMYTVVFYQFDLVFHLLPFLYSLQKHASEITLTSCLLTGLAFLTWAAFVLRQHYDCVRFHDLLSTGRLYFVSCPRTWTVLEHTQRMYLLDPPLSIRERNVAFWTAVTTLTLMILLAASGNNDIIKMRLALGAWMPLHVLKLIFCIICVTSPISCAVAWRHIFYVKVGGARLATK